MSDTIQKKLDKTLAEEDKLRDSLRRVINKRIKLQEKVSAAKFISIFEKSMTPKMFFSIRPSDICGKKLYSMYEFRMQELFAKCNFAVGYAGVMYIEEADSREQVACVQVKFDQNKPFYKQQGILKFVPYMTPIVVKNFLDKKKYKYIDIFEHTLSEDGAYFILITPDKDEAQVVCMRYYQAEVIKKGTVKEMLRFVYDKLPYERKEM